MPSELQLSDSEWELMKILWETAPAAVNDIAGQATQWHPKTVRTMLIRLLKKGIVRHEMRAGVQHYLPVYSRADCEAEATQSFLARVFDGALSPMIAHFTRQQKLTDEEKMALIALLQNNNNQGEK